MSRGFRLAAVERLRVRRFEEAGWALAQAQQTRSEAELRRDALVDHLLACLAPRVADPTAVGTSAERRAQLRDLITAADTELAELAAKVTSARDAWLAARGDLRAVEALHERFRQAQQVEQDRRDQRLADDLAAVRHRAPLIGGARDRHRPGSGGGAA